MVANNRAYAASHPDGPEALNVQTPTLAVASCADARVPLELLFGLRENEAFVVRVAGPTLISEGLGSLDFAVGSLRSIETVLVMGHTRCGAVTGAVKQYRSPTTGAIHDPAQPLDRVIDAIAWSVRLADLALVEALGRTPEQDELVLAATAVHVANEAANLALRYSGRAAGTSTPTLAPVGPTETPPVGWGVFDLATRDLLPQFGDPALRPAPTRASELRTIARQAVGLR